MCRQTVMRHLCSRIQHLTATWQTSRFDASPLAREESVIKDTIEFFRGAYMHAVAGRGPPPQGWCPPAPDGQIQIPGGKNFWILGWSIILQHCGAPLGLLKHV